MPLDFPRRRTTHGMCLQQSGISLELLAPFPFPLKPKPGQGGYHLLYDGMLP